MATVLSSADVLCPMGGAPIAGGGVLVADERVAAVEDARAMGWGDRAGALEPGRRADLVGVEPRTSAAGVYGDLVPGRRVLAVLAVLAGIRAARRPSAGQP